MGIMASMNAMRDYLAGSGLTGIDSQNCVVEDEGVFNRILVDDDDERQRVLMIGYNGVERPRSQKSEFGGSLLKWQIRITIFILLWGDVEERVSAIHAGYGLADEIFVKLNDDPTLNDEVMDAVIVFGDQPMLYTRQQSNEYLMLSYLAEVTENIY